MLSASAAWVYQNAEMHWCQAAQHQMRSHNSTPFFFIVLLTRSAISAWGWMQCLSYSGFPGAASTNTPCGVSRWLVRWWKGGLFFSRGGKANPKCGKLAVFHWPLLAISRSRTCMPPHGKPAKNSDFSATECGLWIFFSSFQKLDRGVLSEESLV